MKKEKSEQKDARRWLVGKHGWFFLIQSTHCLIEIGKSAGEDEMSNFQRGSRTSILLNFLLNGLNSSGSLS